MAAERFVMPARATDVNNKVYPGAKANFYLTGTTTPAAVYSNATLATSLGVTVTADSGGWFPAIYLDPAVTYRCIITNATGSVTIADIDPLNVSPTAEAAAAVAAANAASASAATASTAATTSQAAATAAAAAAAAAETDAATAAAATNSRSATTTALIAAIRNNGFFPQPAYRCPANDVATITVPAGGAASVLTGGASTSANVPVTNTSKITWLGGVAATDVNVTYAPRGAWYAGGRLHNYNAMEFSHTGTALEVQVFCTQVATGTPGFRVFVNDRLSGTATITGDGSNRLIHISFPASGTRRIRVESCGGRFRGVNVVSTSEVAGTGRTYPLISVIGDSFTEGTGASAPIDGEGMALARLLGMNGAIAGVGGTGLLNPGSGGRVNWQDSNRLSDLALVGFNDAITGAVPNLFMGVVALSINDNALSDTNWGGASSYVEAYQKAMYVLIDHWQTNRSGKPLVFFGPTSTIQTPQLDAYRMRDAAEEAIMSMGGPTANLWFIDRMLPDTALRAGSRAIVTSNGTLTSGSKVITGISSTSTFVPGTAVSGTGIPTPSRVVTVDSATQVTIDRNATVSATNSLTFRTDQTAYYTDADNTHPNPAGHSYDARWMAAQLRRLILNEFA